MILQQCRLLVAQTRRDSLAFLLREYDTVESIVDDVIVVESASVLCESVNLAAERAPRPTVEGVAVGGADDVGSSLVNGGVDHVRCGVEQTHRPTINHFAGVVDELARVSSGGHISVQKLTIKSLFRINENETPKGFTQKLSGLTGSRKVICPATPSSKPFFPKIRKAAASRPFMYSRCSSLSSKTGGRGKLTARSWACLLLTPGSRGASPLLTALPLVSVA